MKNRTYVAIDLKSFYASVECVERGLDPITTNLVVADASRTEKTICLAVSPSLRSRGIPGRARLFEVVQRVRQLNAERKRAAPGHSLAGASCDAAELAARPELALDYITATPQMAHYMACSTKIYNIYLKYIAPEDIHVYSIDEVFMDVTAYLATYRLTARQLVMEIILDVLGETGITATAGIGTNLYLAKVAMDIEAKHIPPDKNGVRIAELDEMSYRRSLWAHRPLIDFWRVGRGYAKKLEEHGLHTMGDVARCSLGKSNDYHNEALLYKLFGVNAELLIDHAWGWEPCRMADIKAYKPESSSMGTGQVLQGPYTFAKARLIVREMTDLLVLDLVDKGLATNQLILTVGYDVESLRDPERRKKYKGAVNMDHYGRAVPKHAHGTANLEKYSSSTSRIMAAMSELYDRIVDKDLLVRRVYVVAGNVVSEARLSKEPAVEQLDLFTDQEAARAAQAEEEAALAREKKRQKAILAIQKKYGKNAILKGVNFEDGAMTIARNDQIGGHKA
ncbi:DNA methylase [Ruminococcaceae bacterium OttesenSCG-928-D13]|nr:DNA methylase [Ruminococcaceae bacterium OttesenSCG-928-D13]